MIFRVSIGYGLGESLQDAVSNSLYALKESMNTVDYNSYLINVKKNNDRSVWRWKTGSLFK